MKTEQEIREKIQELTDLTDRNTDFVANELCRSMIIGLEWVLDKELWDFNVTKTNKTV